MKQKALILAALFVGFCFFNSSNALALQSATNGINLSCGESGVLFTNGSNQPTSIDLGADWSGRCALTLSWIDASGDSQRITLAAPPATGAPTSSYQPSGGAFSSLKGGGTISWTTAAGTGGPNVLNVKFERTPSSMKTHGQNSKHTPNLASATIGSVGGKFGALFSPSNNGENVTCGSSGTLFTNLTSAPVTFDLVLNDLTPTGVFHSCTVKLSWTDGNGYAQTLTADRGASQGITSTSLLAGGTIFWSSSGVSSSQDAVQWQVEPAVEFRP